MNDAAPLAHIAIHDTVERILRDLPRGRLLDVPTGEGALAKRLGDLGFEVECADLYPEIFKLPGKTATRADLDRELPFADGSFDYAVCVEGLEHIENPAHAIREFNRVITPGGTLIVSVPNIMNIEERLRWLVSGYTSHFKPLSRTAVRGISDEFPGMEEIALHVNPIGYSEIRYLLENNGFELLSVSQDAPKRNLWAFFPITAAIRLSARFISSRKREARWTDDLNSNEVLLGGNTLIFVARRGDATP